MRLVLHEIQAITHIFANLGIYGEQAQRDALTAYDSYSVENSNMGHWIGLISRLSDHK